MQKTGEKKKKKKKKTTTTTTTKTRHLTVVLRTDLKKTALLVEFPDVSLANTVPIHLYCPGYFLSHHLVFFPPQFLRTKTKHYHIVDKSTYNVNTVENRTEKQQK